MYLDQFLLTSYIYSCAGIKCKRWGCPIWIMGGESDPHPDEVTALLNFNSATSLASLKLQRKQKQLPTAKKH